MNIPTHDEKVVSLQDYKNRKAVERRNRIGNFLQSLTEKKLPMLTPNDCQLNNFTDNEIGY